MFEEPVIERPIPLAPSLDDLILATADGDERAFHRLYLATSDVLYGVALRILGRRDWAEEVLQESFVSVWRHAARFDRSKGAVITWMIRVVRNQAFDWVHPSRPDGFERSHGVSIDWLEEQGAGGLGNEDGFDLLQRLQSKEDAARVSDCLSGLDARQRQGISLVFFHGLSHGDLAAHLRQPLGTVKSWVRRGLASLRRCMAGQTS